MEERGTAEMKRCLGDLIPEFMSFVSLDCTDTGSKIDHTAHRCFLFFTFTARLYLYFYTVYFDKFDVTKRLHGGSFAFAPFTCRNVI